MVGWYIVTSEKKDQHAFFSSFFYVILFLVNVGLFFLVMLCSITKKV